MTQGSIGFRSLTKLLTVCVVAGISAGFAAEALADLDPPRPSSAAPVRKAPCPKGKVYSAKKKACIVKTSQAVTDDDLFAEGHRLIKSGRHAEALETLSLIKNQNQARVLNYIGYTKRKLGNVDEGIRYYLKALELEPEYAVAREYLGEGYIQKGEPAKAREQLAEIEKICGKGCEAYRDLSAAIRKHRS